MAAWLKNMYIHLEFSLAEEKLLIKEQELDSPERLPVLTDKNVHDICNVVRKPGVKSADGIINTKQQISAIAQENLKVAAFLFYHKWRCNLDWKPTRVNEDTLHLMEGQKEFKDKNKVPNLLPKTNESDMTEMMEAIEEYLS